jgi:transcriptional regulator with XRE-family HTH domain
MIGAVAKTRESDENPERLSAREERARANVERWIATSGYTITQVADLAGIPQASLARWLTGKHPIPYDAFQPLADALGRESLEDFSSPSPPRQRTKEELALLMPVIGKHRPGAEPTQEDIDDYRDYLRKVQGRREKKKSK